MRSLRGRQSDDSAPGQDSFLDIVSNIVGILIILVMVACARVQSMHEAPPPVDLSEQVEALHVKQAESQRLYERNMELGAKIKAVEQEEMQRNAERDRLATLVVAIERGIEDHQSRLAEDEREAFELERRRIEAEAELEDARNALATVEEAPRDTVVLKNYPTPISRSSDEREIHFRLLGGQLAEIPMDLLVDRAKRIAMRDLGNLSKRGESSGMVGPINGFRMIYTFVVVDQVMATLAKATFVADSPTQGEAVATVLSPDSQFLRTLTGHSPKTTTVTIWLYPDGFDQVRPIRERLHEMGFAVAIRPMQSDAPIVASAFGTKSSGQ